MGTSIVGGCIWVLLFLTWAPGKVLSTSSSICSTANIVLSKSSVTYLTAPSDGAGATSCIVQVNHEQPEESRSNILLLRVLSFQLAGQYPCNPADEHLKIVFENNPGENNVIMWCGQSYAPTLETRQNLQISYFSGIGRRGQFNISLSLVDTFCKLGQTQELAVGEEPMFIYSPGYPNSYDHQVQCKWSVFHDQHQLLIDSLKFHLEPHTACSYDYLAVDGRKFCGDQRVYTTSGRQNIVIDFNSDHSKVYDGFILKLLGLAQDNPVCTTTVKATTTPQMLHLPSMQPGMVNSINCFWILDSGSEDKLVLLDMKRFYTTASCRDFQLAVYDGNSTASPRIKSGCAPQQMFQIIRSSGRFLYLDVDLMGFGYTTVEVEFTVTSSLRATPPRVLYAGFADSYLWMDLDASEGLGLLLRGTDDDPENYTTCLHLTALETPCSTSSYNISDFIFAYSGWNDTFMELGTSCGHSSSVEVISRGSKIFIKPKRPSFSQNIQTVWLIFRLQRFCTPAVVLLQASSTEQQLKSDIVWPTGHYPNNARCRWLIRPLQAQTTQIRVIRSNLFPYFCNDNVTVYEYGSSDGTETKLIHWCADETPIIMGSTGEGLLVEFISDAKITSTGFEIAYSSISLRNECPNMASIIADENATQTLSSPNYPYDYPNNIDCKWRITASQGVVQLKLLSVSIAQQAQACAKHDYLVIYDGPDVSGPVLVDLCGNGFLDDTYISTSKSMVVHFHSDSAISARGFQLEFFATQNVDRFQCNKNLYVKDGDFQYITSPYYPGPYPRDTDCYWKVSAPVGRIVVLEVVDRDLPLCQDNVRVYDGDTANSPILAKICNSNPENRLTTSQQFMYITFRSSSFGTFRGFKFRVRSGQEVLRCDGRVISLTAYTKDYITSPNYPRNYPANADCNWRIESAYDNMTVMLEIEDVQLERSFTCLDSLSIYDGYDDASALLDRICGEMGNEHSGIHFSSGRYMFVHFKSDTTTELRGFQLGYMAVTDHHFPNSPEAESSQSSTGAVVGGVTGAAVFLLVGITIFLCFLIRYRRHKLEHSRQHQYRSEHSEGNSTVYFLSPVIVNQVAPPPYPGQTSASYAISDAPPAYTVAYSNIQPPPPSYAELEPPPLYCETMIVSHPPSSPPPNTDSSRAPMPPTDGQTRSGQNFPMTQPEPRVVLLPVSRHRQPAIHASPPASAELPASTSLLATESRPPVTARSGHTVSLTLEPDQMKEQASGEVAVATFV